MNQHYEMKVLRKLRGKSQRKLLELWVLHQYNKFCEELFWPINVLLYWNILRIDRIWRHTFYVSWCSKDGNGRRVETVDINQSALHLPPSVEKNIESIYKCDVDDVVGKQYYNCDKGEWLSCSALRKLSSNTGVVKSMVHRIIKIINCSFTRVALPPRSL